MAMGCMYISARELYHSHPFYPTRRIEDKGNHYTLNLDRFDEISARLIWSVRQAQTDYASRVRCFKPEHIPVLNNSIPGGIGFYQL